MHDAQTWCKLVADIIRDRKEKQRLINELGITSITLTRWVNGESDPRPQNLRRLIRALARYQAGLLKEESNFSEQETALEPIELTKEISSEFYAQILQMRASTSENVRFWSTCHLILQQALKQLDPGRLGMAIRIIRCMPPSGPYNKVRSLRESIGLGTPPWSGNLEQTAVFLGTESLISNVVTLCRPIIFRNLEYEYLITPTGQINYECSAAAHPILLAGRIAGVLLVSSTQKNYFLSQASTDLIQRYADLVALAFDAQEFYSPEQIAFSIMPSPEEQRASLANFRQRVYQTAHATNQKYQRASNTQVDLLVWQRLEDEFLSFPTLTNAST